MIPKAKPSLESTPSSLQRPISFSPQNPKPSISHSKSPPSLLEYHVVIEQQPNQDLLTQHKSSKQVKAVQFDRFTFFNGKGSIGREPGSGSALHQQYGNLPYFREPDPDREQQCWDFRGSGGSYESNFQRQNDDQFMFQQHSIKINKQSSKIQQDYLRKLSNPKMLSSTIQSQHIHYGKKMQADCLIKINKNQYEQTYFKISQNLLEVKKNFIQITQIQKISIHQVSREVDKFSMIKFNVKSQSKKNNVQEICLGISKSSRWGELPLSYYTFAKLIIKRLKKLGVAQKTQWSPLAQISPKRFHIKLKQTQTPKDSSSKKNVQAYTHYEARTHIHGLIYKKSKFLGKWEKRYVTVNQLGVYSYRSQNDSDYSVSIQNSSVCEILTNFFVLVVEKYRQGDKNRQQQIWEEKIKQLKDRNVIQKLITQMKQKQTNGQKTSIFLIVRIKQSTSQCTQFAIPICNFDSDSCDKNWLLAFFKILPNLNKKKLG